MRIIKLYAIVFNLCILVESKSNEGNITEEEYKIKNYINITRLKDTFDIFDIKIVGAKWIDIRKTVGDKCSKNMMNYLNGLEENKIWAIKSE